MFNKLINLSKSNKIPNKITFLYKFSLYIRINKVLKLANKCIKHKINFPTEKHTAYKSRYRYKFICNRCDDKFGLYYNNVYECFDSLAFFIGPYNYVTICSNNGFNFKFIHNLKNFHNEYTNEELTEMFIKRFNSFEKEFLIWIKSLKNKGELK